MCDRCPEQQNKAKTFRIYNILNRKWLLNMNAKNSGETKFKLPTEFWFSGFENEYSRLLV